MAETRWLTGEEARAWRGFERMRVELTARLDRHLLRDSGLSGSDYEVLVHLSEEPTGRLRAFELGAAMQWEKSRLSHHLSRMERRGLVRREQCPTDARGLFVTLTDEGRAAIEDAAPQHVEQVRRHFVDVLTPEQLVTMAGIADAVLAELHGTDESSDCGDTADAC